MLNFEDYWLKLIRLLYCNMGFIVNADINIWETKNTVKMYIVISITYNVFWERANFLTSHILYGCILLLHKWMQSCHILLVIHCRVLRKPKLFKKALHWFTHTHTVHFLHPLICDDWFLTCKESP